MWAIIRKFVKNQKKGRFETNKKGFDKIRMESFFPTCMAKLSHGMNSKGQILDMTQGIIEKYYPVVIQFKGFTQMIFKSCLMGLIIT